MIIGTPFLLISYTLSILDEWRIKNSLYVVFFLQSFPKNHSKYGREIHQTEEGRGEGGG